jgi:hypothetical protein
LGLSGIYNKPLFPKLPPFSLFNTKFPPRFKTLPHSSLSFAKVSTQGPVAFAIPSFPLILRSSHFFVSSFLTPVFSHPASILVFIPPSSGRSELSSKHITHIVLYPTIHRPYRPSTHHQSTFVHKNVRRSNRNRCVSHPRCRRARRPSKFYTSRAVAVLI